VGFAHEYKSGLIMDSSQDVDSRSRAGQTRGLCPGLSQPAIVIEQRCSAPQRKSAVVEATAESVSASASIEPPC
jgi:hypothetical protein